MLQSLAEVSAGGDSSDKGAKLDGADDSIIKMSRLITFSLFFFFLFFQLLSIIWKERTGKGHKNSPVCLSWSVHLWICRGVKTQYGSRFFKKVSAQAVINLFIKYKHGFRWAKLVEGAEVCLIGIIQRKMFLMIF